MRKTLTSLLQIYLCVLLSSCGGGNDFPLPNTVNKNIQGPLALDQLTPAMKAAKSPSVIKPTFKLVENSSPSATPPRSFGAFGTYSALRAFRSGGARALNEAAPLPSVHLPPYTPMDIRSAYGMDLGDELVPNGASHEQWLAANLGAGQTIYIIDAHEDPSAASSLAAFSAAYGLPGCEAGPMIAEGQALPLPPASAGCTFSIARLSSQGYLAPASAPAPSYDSNWAIEEALDIQWAHATAPLARIVLIEIPEPSPSLAASAVLLAGKMGPGIVSMSFSAESGDWTRPTNLAFNQPESSAMTYVASAGDNGYGIGWPAESPQVWAVGGTSLPSWSGPTSAATETAWSQGGAGVAAGEPLPAHYQNNLVPGYGAHIPGNRIAADAAIVADPATGVSVALGDPNGRAPAIWIQIGGTSAGSPMWSGIFAVANARRAALGRAPLGRPHAAVYHASLAAATYADAFNDITTGSDGLCADCSAHAGFDAPTGLGTPHSLKLWASLDSAPSQQDAAFIPSNFYFIGSNRPMALDMRISNPPNCTCDYLVSGAPSGMGIDESGHLVWDKPVPGIYYVGVISSNRYSGATSMGHALIQISFQNSPPDPTPPPPTATPTYGQTCTNWIAASFNSISSCRSQDVGEPDFPCTCGTMSDTEPVRCPNGTIFDAKATSFDTTRVMTCYADGSCSTWSDFSPAASSICL